MCFGVLAARGFVGTAPCAVKLRARVQVNDFLTNEPT